MIPYYYLYKITNLVNGKIYVGVHQTQNKDDEYMGSGLLIKRAIEKYGIENFKKEILEYFSTESDMYDAESFLVNSEFVADTNTYNIKEGGHGGWDHINSDKELKRDISKRSNEARAKRIQHGLSTFNDSYERTFMIRYRVKNPMQIPEVLNKQQCSLKKYNDNNPGAFTGKHHTDETKAKIGAANSKHQSGSGNSQYGKMWIYNEDLKECKRIPKDDPIPEGWKRGRKMSFN
jgi:group I intron endonuclease